MRMSLLRAYAALLITAFATLAHAAQPASCSAASPAHRVALVELYTSEGCDSCPSGTRDERSSDVSATRTIAHERKPRV